ncbi:unnamed protein product [Colletotrichum noveboracense]|uniref:Major facilitator superfamily transporter n=1 Tax=Colletotrichum noveboracense TaxID=2664923 RepID=A0A9W4RIP6_9PEZI|nr:unnamed protein product [Colletotrichum noveboracense]
MQTDIERGSRPSPSRNSSLSTLCGDDVSSKAPTICGRELPISQDPSQDKHRSEPESLLVSWDGPHDPENPKNWDRRQKWTVVIFNVTVQAVAFFLLKETYAPRLLVLKARKLRKESRNPEFQTAWEREQRTLTKILRVSLSRPWVMLATQPIIQSLAILQAFNFGLLYLVISGFPTLWEEHYGISKGRASLNYISIAVGSLIGVLICAPTMDAVYRRLKTKSGIGMEEQRSPEFRIPLMIPSSVITPAGMLLFAWSAQNRMHFLIPNIGIAITMGSTMISYQCISAYIADSYPQYTASASATCCFMRSMFAFVFPLFVPALFGKLGYGLGGSLLAGIAVVIGIPAPILLWVFGARLRCMSRFSIRE